MLVNSTLGDIIFFLSNEKPQNKMINQRCLLFINVMKNTRVTTSQYINKNQQINLLNIKLRFNFVSNHFGNGQRTRRTWRWCISAVQNIFCKGIVTFTMIEYKIVH